MTALSNVHRPPSSIRDRRTHFAAAGTGLVGTLLAITLGSASAMPARDDPPSAPVPAVHTGAHYLAHGCFITPHTRTWSWSWRPRVPTTDPGSSSVWRCPKPQGTDGANGSGSGQSAARARGTSSELTIVPSRWTESWSGELAYGVHPDRWNVGSGPRCSSALECRVHGRRCGVQARQPAWRRVQVPSLTPLLGRSSSPDHSDADRGRCIRGCCPSAPNPGVLEMRTGDPIHERRPGRDLRPPRPSDRPRQRLPG